MKGFRNFLLRGDIIVVAVGLIVALAFSTLIGAFTTSVINPIIARAEGKTSSGLGWQLGAAGNKPTFLDIGAFISAVIYFVIFMAVVYFVIVIPYKVISARRPTTSARRDRFRRRDGAGAGRAHQASALGSMLSSGRVSADAGSPAVSELKAGPGATSAAPPACWPAAL